MHAPAKSSYPICEVNDLLQYDAVLFGIPTRYGNLPAQWKTFWDATGSIWATGGYWGKYAGLFISTGTPGGGQESTAISTMSTLTHHGFVYVPLGYKHTFAQLANLEEVHGGSPWGAGTFAVSILYLFFPFFSPPNTLLTTCFRVPTVPASLPLLSCPLLRLRERPSTRLLPRPTSDCMVVASRSPRPRPLLRGMLRTLRSPPRGSRAPSLQ